MEGQSAKQGRHAELLNEELTSAAAQFAKPTSCSFGTASATVADDDVTRFTCRPGRGYNGKTAEVLLAYIRTPVARHVDQRPVQKDQ